MLSSVFWLSLVGVFLGMKWLAEGLWSLSRIEVRHVQPVAAEPSPRRDFRLRSLQTDAASKEAA